MSGDISKSTTTPPVEVVKTKPEDIVSGDIIAVDFPHVRPSYDATGKKVFSKERPALTLYTKPRQMVVAYITSKIPAYPSSADVLVMIDSPSFEGTGLTESSVIRLDVLATIPFEKVLGWNGSIDDTLREEINTKLAKCIRV